MPVKVHAALLIPCLPSSSHRYVALLGCCTSMTPAVDCFYVVILILMHTFVAYSFEHINQLSRYGLPKSVSLSFDSSNSEFFSCHKHIQAVEENFLLLIAMFSMNLLDFLLFLLFLLLSEVYCYVTWIIKVAKVASTA